MHSKLQIFLLLLLGQLAAGICNADNCLRAFRASHISGRLKQAQSFCSTFTKGPFPSAALPTYAVEACKENINGPLSFRVSSACTCIQTATPTTTASSKSSPPVIATEPCAQVSRLAETHFATRTGFVGPTIAAVLAQDCLNSVPLGKEDALKLVDSIVPYVEWQSDLAFLKNPPAGYFFKSHDIIGSLALIKSNLQKDFYRNEIEFELDLYRVFLNGHDGHLFFLPDALSAAFDFVRPKALVSVSKNGIDLPQIKLYDDVVASPATAPTIKKINGVDAVEFVSKLAFTSASQQDADAAYDAMFFSEANYFMSYGGRGYFAGSGRGRFLYPGQNTTFLFDNGTSVTLENIARLRSDFTGVKDGKSFYQKFCAQQNDGFDENENPKSFLGTAAYPSPVISERNGEIGGFYLNGSDFADVAVLSVIGFAPWSNREFQYVADTFFAGAIKSKKQKLVIDLSANGGGYILQGYDLFRQLFPSIVQEGLSRFRESDTLLAMAKIVSDRIPPNYNPKTADMETIDFYESFFNYRYDLNRTNQPFTSFNAKFPGKVVRGDPNSALLRWNLDDELTTSNTTWGLGIDITGYGNRTNFTQPFKTENIIILTDGYCASTCSLFTDFMRAAGVKIVSMGGRPQAGLAQAVGGVKGSQSLGFESIYYYSRMARKYGTTEQKATLDRLTTYPMYRSLAAGINARDTILPQNINDGTPSQFITELADCRLFWTAPMITDITQVWKAVARVAFQGAKCAAGALPKREANAEAQAQAEAVAWAESHAESIVLQKGKFALPGAVARETDAMWEARHGRKGVI